MNNLIEVNKGTMSGGVFYGSININGNRVGVGNLLTEGGKYNFRIITKARAGFPTIAEFNCTVEGLPYYLSKSTTYVEFFKESSVGGKGNWFSVLTTKGGKWYSIDKVLLETLTVGDMHGSFPKMIDWSIWKAMNTKFHSCKSFVMNELEAA